MQKVSLVRLRRYRVLLWCLALSLVFHFLLIPLIVALFGWHGEQEPREVVYQTSSSLRIARRTVPRPTRRQQPRHVQQPHPVPQPRPVREQTQAAPGQERPELARIQPHAPVSVPHLSPSNDFAGQQAQFEKTIAKLREESDPITGASRPVQAPSAPKRYAFDFSGSVGTAPQAEGILTPVKSWHDGQYDYYYVQYWAQYADGTVETGYVPWPLRYLPKDDPFLQHWEHFPLPVPLPDYVLPADTNLHPLVAFCYEHRSEFNSCPIEHG